MVYPNVRGSYTNRFTSQISFQLTAQRTIIELSALLRHNKGHYIKETGKIVRKRQIPYHIK